MKFADRVARANCGNGCVKDMVAMQADAAIATKDAEIASLRDRLRDTAQILIAEVGATGPADAEEVARKAVSQIARLREALEKICAGPTPPDEGGREEWHAYWRELAVNRWGIARDALQARAALAQVAEVGNG